MKTAFAQTANSAQNIANETTSELVQFIELVITKIPLWIAAFVVIFAAFIIAKIARRIVENKLAEKGVEEEHKELQVLAGRITYSGFLIVGITVGLKIGGIDLTSIIAAGAFGIGFALKDLIMNFLAGVMILVSRHFSIGDFIKVGGTMGKVIEIQSRNTILQAIDGTKVIVPNADLFKKEVTSFTSNAFRRIEFIVGVDYRHDLKNVVKVCKNVVKNTKGVLVEPKPAVVVDDFGDSAISIKIRAWVESRGGWVKIKSRLAIALKEAFDEHGITIPWPIRTIAYDKDNHIEEKPFQEPEEPEEETPAPTPSPAAPQAAAQQAPATVPVTEPTASEAQLRPISENKNL